MNAIEQYQAGTIHWSRLTVAERDSVRAQSNARTVPGIGPGGWDAGTLAREQERAATVRSVRDVPAVRPDVSAHDANALYAIYTEQTGDVLAIVARYFRGATMHYVTGLWDGIRELAVVVEIIGTVADREQVVALCEDIRATNAQHTVLATMQTARSLDSIVVTAPTIDAREELENTLTDIVVAAVVSADVVGV